MPRRTLFSALVSRELEDSGMKGNNLLTGAGCPDVSSLPAARARVSATLLARSLGTSGARLTALLPRVALNLLSN